MKCDRCDKPGVVPYKHPNGDEFTLCVQCAKDLQAGPQQSSGDRRPSVPKAGGGDGHKA